MKKRLEMELTLSVVSYHRFTSGLEISKTLTKHSDERLTIGRAPDCEWQLPDPERVISGRHADICQSAEGWVVRDTSTNGLYVNRAVSPLGDDEHLLTEGDLLTLGDYEIEISSGDKVDDDKHATSEPVHPQILNGNPSKLAAAEEEFGFSMSALNNQAKQSEPKTVVSNNSATPSFDLSDSFFPPSTEANKTNTAPAETIIPDEWDSLVGNLATPAVAAASPAVETQKPAEVVSKSAAPSVASTGMEAFMKGAGIPAEMIPKEHQGEWWGQLGMAFNEMMSGLMATLHSRSEFKSEFRVNQTMFNTRENNPLKFSATFEDALHNLFNRNGPGFLPAVTAIQEAHRDIAQHERALMSGLEGTLVGVLGLLEPGSIESRQYAQTLLEKMNPAQVKARYWNLYCQLYGDLHSELSEKGPSLYMDDFVKAYEASIQQQKDQQGD
ncbi:type VI secretion system-associated FHA domain protein TagH [Corallincola holothuriorum]|uniref:Type VI secretion system-associated FHA domain protein TagH n=2 Tax=Corallincola holothuriorum TaxID=2282215 RepID=A0A368NQC0_9GAMM|nr:type VI secretion system-associated FHA domain protein TagH [Corallincola holothuriorum]